MDNENTEQNNQARFAIELMHIVVTEIMNNKWKVVCCIAVINFIVLMFGLIYPNKYETYTILYADKQNILKPILEGKANITKIMDNASVVKDVIYSPRIMNEVVSRSGMLAGKETATEKELIANKFRGGITVESTGSNFIKIMYSSESPEETYNIANIITDIFITDAENKKKGESKGAFIFIDKQVKAYKEKLQVAENNLKEFKSNNFDGNQAAVQARIDSLRLQIEEMKFDVDDTKTRVASLEGELSNENYYQARAFQAGAYRERLEESQRELEKLRLTYTDTYPDIVALKQQIKEISLAIQGHENKKQDVGVLSSELYASPSESDVVYNPLYGELRSKLAQENIDLKTKNRRLAATEYLLNKEYERFKRTASKQAEYSELTRDYNVTKSIYEDMLERKEVARLSMTLDVEGQGVNYKIHETAAYPLMPSGVRFAHFVIAGPFAGIFITIGIILSYIILDPRIRFLFMVEEIAPVISVVPRVMTPTDKKIMRTDICLLWMFAFVVALVYASIAFARIRGLL